MIFSLLVGATADSAGHGPSRREMTSDLETVVAVRLLPILLPIPQTAADAWRRMWNSGRGSDHGWTALDDLPEPTDQKVNGLKG